MKRNLLVAAAMAVVLVAANLRADESIASQAVAPDWHYRWHEGRWWYWMSENSKWMYWTGSAWAPFQQRLSGPGVSNVSQSNTSNGNFETGIAESAYSGGGSLRSPYSGYSGRSTSGYSGYGWSWGPGTAFRDSPGRRF